MPELSINAHRYSATDSPSFAFPATIYPWAFLWRSLQGRNSAGPIRLHIIRHAETTANSRQLIAGQTDVDLSMKGYLQALMLGLRLPRYYDVAWVSSLSRTRKTLEYAECMRFRRTSLTVWADSRLNERSLGKLEGTPRQVIDAYANGDLVYAPPGGESYLDLAQRILSFLLDVRRSTSTALSVISTHVGPMRLLVGMLERFDDPKRVLSLTFKNAEACECVLNELVWPKFITREVLLAHEERILEPAYKP